MKNLFAHNSLCTAIVITIFTLKIHLVNVSEPYKNCRVMPACFRFSIITSRCSELAWVVRSVRRAMLRRSHFFPLKNTVSINMKIHGKDFFPPVVNSDNHIWDTSSFLLCSFLKEIHTDNKSIHPCWTGVKEPTHIICTQTGYDTLIVPKSLSLQHSYSAHGNLLTWRRPLNISLTLTFLQR